jgi:hypothetical protein
VDIGGANEVSAVLPLSLLLLLLLLYHLQQYFLTCKRAHNLLQRDNNAQL